MGIMGHEITYMRLSEPHLEVKVILQVHFRQHQLLVIGYVCYGDVGTMKILYINFCQSLLL